MSFVLKSEKGPDMQKFAIKVLQAEEIAITKAMRSCLKNNKASVARV